MLPNLTALRLGCQPCGGTFEDFDDAQGSVPPGVETRNDWDARKWRGEQSPECIICGQLLEDNSPYGAETNEVEALFENPECSHCFHRECLEQWIEGAIGEGNRIIERRLRCPTCSRPIDQTVLDTIFDARAGIEEVPEDDGFVAEGELQAQTPPDLPQPRTFDPQRQGMLDDMDVGRKLPEDWQ